MNHVDLTAALAEAAEHRRKARERLAEATRRMELADALARESRKHRFSFVRAITAAGTDGLRDGIEAEVSQELACRSGASHDIHRPFLPWSDLAHYSRAMIVGTASSGGYLVSEPASEPVAALFPYSVAVRLGAQVWPGMVGDVNIPRINANGTAYWLTELGTATESAPTLGQINCSPRRPGAYTAVSRNLNKLPPGRAEAMVANHLLDLTGGLIDKAVYNGTSTDGTQPVGIVYTSGATVTLGTGFDAAAAQAMVKAVGNANAADVNIRAVGSPTVRELLAKRAANGTGSPSLWSDGTLANAVPAASSSNVLASALFVGDFTTIVLPFWGEGLQVESNPYANFQAGIIGFRVLPAFDVAVTQPAAFAVSTGLT